MFILDIPVHSQNIHITIIDIDSSHSLVYRSFVEFSVDEDANDLFQLNE